MIAYLVVDLIASGRAVVSRDREMLRSWRHNYGAVLRRGGNKRSLPAVAVTTSSRTSNPADSSVDAEAHASVASESAIEAFPKKKAKVTKEPSAGRLWSGCRSVLVYPPFCLILMDLPQRGISRRYGLDREVQAWIRF